MTTTKTEPIFNSATKLVAELHFISGGAIPAIKYLRTLGLPFKNAKRLVFDFFINPPEEIPFLPPAPEAPILN